MDRAPFHGEVGIQPCKFLLSHTRRNTQSIRTKEPDCVCLIPLPPTGEGRLGGGTFFQGVSSPQRIPLTSGKPIT